MSCIDLLGLVLFTLFDSFLSISASLKKCRKLYFPHHRLFSSVGQTQQPKNGFHATQSMGNYCLYLWTSVCPTTFDWNTPMIHGSGKFFPQQDTWRCLRLLDSKPQTSKSSISALKASDNPSEQPHKKRLWHSTAKSILAKILSNRFCRFLK